MVGFIMYQSRKERKENKRKGSGFDIPLTSLYP